MKCYSTNNRKHLVSFQDAVLKGLAEDNGLFMPAIISKMPVPFFEQIHSLSFPEIALYIAAHLLADEFPLPGLQNIIDKALDFDAPLVQLDDNLYVLELFHGPTLSFKDFAARFMAELLSHIAQNMNQNLTILVATSGDTGSAVAHAFLNTPKIKVIILYPKAKVSVIQEKQFTTLGNNITACEVDGTFDDCQKLVKQAFLDSDINKKLFLTSANSINIARLIPQSFYYFYAYAQLKKYHFPISFSIPCGNLGNLTGGLIAKWMGLPVSHFIAATNCNDTFPKYIHTGIFKAQPTKRTISNAMDVGSPNNIARIIDLYDKEVERIRQDIVAASFSDEQTKTAMHELFHYFSYIADPHGAIGYLGLKEFIEKKPGQISGIFLETTHPAKFPDIVQDVIGKTLLIPQQLQQCLKNEKQSLSLSSTYEDFKEFLLTSIY